MSDRVTREGAGAEDRALAEALTEGPLSECCVHDETAAYLKKYECFPADWTGARREDSCFVNVIADALRAASAAATAKEKERINADVLWNGHSAKEWSLALQSLTPQGSEFASDPKVCVAYVREERAAMWKRFKAARQEFRILNADLRSMEQVISDALNIAVTSWPKWNAIELESFLRGFAGRVRGDEQEGAPQDEKP